MKLNPKKHKDARRKRAKIKATHQVIYAPYERVSQGGVKHTNYKRIIKKI